MTKSKYNPQIHHRRSIRLKGYNYSEAGLYFVTICCEDRECRFGNIENDKMILNEFGNVAYNEWTKLTERFTNFELDVFQIMPNHMHGIIMLNTVGAGFTPALNPNSNNTPAQNSNNTLPVNSNNASPVNENNTSPINSNNTSHVNSNNISIDENNTSPVNSNNISPQNPNNTSWVNSNNISRVDEKNISLHSNNTSPINQNHTPIINEKGQPRGFAPTTTTIGDIVGAYKSLSANGCLKIYKCKNQTMGKLWQRNYYEHIIRDEQSYHTISDYIINNPAKWMKDKFFQQKLMKRN